MTHLNRLYPHLLREDCELWEEFMRRNGSKYHHYEYDIKVGDGRDPGASYQENIRSMAHELSKRRIDVIAFTNHELHLIEITQSAGFTAIGQILAYPVLYKLKNPQSSPIVGIILCREIQTDITPALAALGIHYCVLPERGTQQTTLPMLRQPAAPQPLSPNK